MYKMQDPGERVCAICLHSALSEPNQAIYDGPIGGEKGARWGYACEEHKRYLIDVSPRSKAELRELKGE